MTDGDSRNEPAMGLDEPAVHYHGHRERLRARLRDAGPDAVTDYELLELVLFRAIPQRDVKPLAKELIANFLRGDYDKAQGDKFNAAGGKQLDPFPAEDREAFYQAALSIWERDATQKGGDMATNRETLLQALQD